MVVTFLMFGALHHLPISITPTRRHQLEIRMSAAIHDNSKNLLLNALPKQAYQPLAAHLERVSLGLREVLFDPGRRIRYVYFPLSGVCSLVSVLDGGRVFEVATVGKEGIVGLPVFLGFDSTPLQAFSQVAGESLRLETEVFKDAVRRSGALHDLLQRYAQALFVQVAQSAACNLAHSIEQRCARWLLMTHDRMGGLDFALTQEFLAQMLGVSRQRVSSVAVALRLAGLISYSRGSIQIVDRRGLVAQTCECYEIVRAEYDRLANSSPASTP